MAAPRALRVPRDGAARVGAMVRMDAQNRIYVTQVAEAAGWPEATMVTVSVEGSTVCAAPGAPTQPWQTPTGFKAGRLTLPPPVRALLGVLTGDQVVACHEPGTDRIVITAAADLLQTLTGPVAAPQGAPAEVAPPVRRGGVKPAWRAPAAVAT